MIKIGKKRFKWSWGQLFINLTMAFLLFTMAYPLLMSFWCAFKSIDQYDTSKFYPTFPLKLSNLAVAFDKISLYTYNTIAVAIFGITGSLIIASLAAFAFARMEFPGKKIFFTLVLCLMMIPGVLTLVPQFLLYKSMNLQNKLVAILLPQITLGPVGAVFLLTIFFRSLPKELFEAARMDGAGPFKTYLKVALPLSMPILITQAIMQINGIWNDYIWPMTVISTNYENLTISAGLLLNLEIYIHKICQ